MIIICEECSKKYRLDANKLQGESARFKCKACDHLIQLTVPTQGKDFYGSGGEGATPPHTSVSNENLDRIETKHINGKQYAISDIVPDSENADGLETYSMGFGDTGTDDSVKDISLPFETLPISATRSLRTKMIILFFFLPVTLFTISSAFFLFQMNRLENLLTNESVRIVNRMAEEKIADLSRAVATQCKLYLMNKPSLKKEKFAQDVKFEQLAVQKVGTTGYTALYERPGKDGVWRTWSHVQPKIIGIDMAELKKPLGSNFDGFWQIFTGVKGGEESKGYYTWKDSDNRLRKKFMACTPIEGTKYVIAATTYLEELTQSVTELKYRSHMLARRVITVIAIILVTTLILIGAIVLIYSFRLTRKIRRLTEVTDRISIGDLDAHISVRSKDEIGELAEAISRMQESIRLSIERLRSRR